MPTEPATEYDPSLGNKFIFVTGGVMSGLGKGITAASTGRLLKNAGLDVTAVKIDPYLNVDAGTMNPYQHGEVFVLKDGAEVDLDLGNYERFLDIDMTATHNITTGKVYRRVIDKERSGDYLGSTVQIIPHITDEIKRRIREAATDSDVCIVEVGGTVGDIESMPFLEALRQFADEEPVTNVLFAHVTLVPQSKNGEQKTKPTQHSVKELRSIGLQPDVLIGRSDDPLEPATKSKIALFCDVPDAAVFSNPDVSDIYHVPMEIEKEGLDTFVINRLSLEDRTNPKRQTVWRDTVTRGATDTVRIALVGKYALEDAYFSIHEALKHAGLERSLDVEVLWVDADRMADNHRERLQSAEGIVVPGGFGSRGTSGKIGAIEHARVNAIPLLGLCLGFQLSVVEFARNVVDLTDAHSTEIDESTPHPVIDLLPEQDDVDDMGGTMRLGAHETQIAPNTLAAKVYDGADACIERHRHRYEVNPAYISDLEDAGMTFSGRADRRMEILELPDHPFFFGTQFHPEFQSRPGRVSPPFAGFLESVLENRDRTEAEVEA